MKSKNKSTRPFHTANTQKGSGVYYGTGIKNPIAKSVSVMGKSPSLPKSLKKPPKSFA